MKAKLIWTLAFVCLLGCACQREVIEPQTPTLQVEKSDSKVVLTAEGTDVSLGVTTNSDDWSAMAQDAWLEVIKGDKQITLRAQRNTLISSRSTLVQVFAGGLSRQITVEQLSGSAVIEVGLAPQIVDQWGGELRIDVSSNTDTWQATTDADWITLERDTKEQQLIVSVAEHTERKGRVAVIEFRSAEGAEPKTMEVHQDGIRYWLLPIFGKPLTIDDAQAKEVARRHKLVEQPISAWAFEKIYKFGTISPALPRVDYVFNRTSDFLFAKTILKDVATLEGDEYTEFTKYLLANKFEDKGNRVFWSEDLRTEAEVILEATEPYIKYTYYPEDPYNHPTIDIFPLSSIVLGESTPEQIDAHQKALGTMLDDTRSSLTRKVYTKKVGTKQIVYDYAFTAGKLSKLTYADGIIGHYIYLNGSLVYLNRSFRELIQNEGFRFHARDPYASYLKDTYRNAAKRVEMLVEVGTNPYDRSGVAVVLTFKTY